MYMAKITDKNEKTTVKTGNFILITESSFIPPKVPARMTAAI
jgi:hypothetical protein